MTRKKRALNDEMKEYYSNANAKPGRKETDLNTEMLEYFYNANVNGGGGGGGGGGAVESVNGHKGVVVLKADDIKSDADWTPTLPIDLTTKKYVDDKIGEIPAGLGKEGDQTIKNGWLTIDSSANVYPWKPAGLTIKGKTSNGHLTAGNSGIFAKLSQAFDGLPTQGLGAFVDFKKPTVIDESNWCYLIGYKNSMLIKRPRVEGSYYPEADNSLVNKRYVDKKRDFGELVLTDAYQQLTCPVDELYHTMDPTTYGYGNVNNFTINFIEEIQGLPNGAGQYNTLLTFNTKGDISNQILFTTNGDMYIANIKDSSPPVYKKVLTETAMKKRTIEKDKVINDLLDRVEALEAKLASK